MAQKRKLSAFTVKDKVRIINFVENNPNRTRKDIANELQVSEPTLSRICSKKAEILKEAASGELSNCKRKRLSEYPDLEKSLFIWFKQTRDKDIPVSGTLLKEKAKKFADSLKIDDFKASNGWLDGFKKRHSISFRKICGEEKAVNSEVCESWLEDLPKLTDGYSPTNIYNADETGLFYKCLPDRTLTLKNETCKGGKHSKERITVLLATDMTGQNKLPPLVIGKSAKPRCFKGVKSLPFTYKSNKKAWMTSELFKIG